MNKAIKHDLESLISRKNIQAIQDSFSDAMGLASVITHPNGTPITRPSNFSSICSLVRTTEEGKKNCILSDACLGKNNTSYKHHKCLSACLYDGAANIYVGDQKVAIWIIGQIITEDVDENEVINYMTHLGIDRDKAIEALTKSTRMPLKQFKNILNSLSVFANQLSKSAYQNALLKLHQENLESLVQEQTQDLEHAFNVLSEKNAELHTKNELIKQQNQDLKRTLRELKSAETHLVQAEKMASLGILTAGVAHEINNPLNFIAGSQLALEQLFKQNQLEYNKERTAQLLKNLKIGVQRSSDIVSSLNQFSRKNTSFEEECLISNIIDNCLVMLTNQTKHKVKIEKQYASSPLIVKGNMGGLHQVFLNVISNASQAIVKSGKITIKTYQKGSNAAITIQDNGVGISPNNIKKVLDPFYTTKAPGLGTGLGLSISHNIIKNHKGELYIDSKEGIGSMVTIKLPLYTNSTQ